ncbi:hypothetical protein KHA93_06145 [Bacillus sp. FJAT-49732]|uniref:Uncharacterized protein n=1 Tax=Lederbergia citrisecunda TaxID=2833583 RepID=A0A942YKG4_9BACI|nr:hypothetical protein [Lederbergia citrisecunda]MBS4199234.1 hypothetical protein [Lederbergia citrisecunda]
MKTKLYAIIIMSFILFFAGAIGYEGLHSNASTTPQKTSDMLIHPQKSNSELTKNLVLVDDVTKENDLESSVVTEESLPEEVTIDNTVFVNIMNDNKFSDLSKLARKYNAGLYAIPYSDVVAIVKDGNPIFFMSAGSKSAVKEYSDLLSESLAFSGFENLDEVRENMNTVLETGKEVNVDNSNEEYSIFQVDGWIYVSW